MAVQSGKVSLEHFADVGIPFAGFAARISPIVDVIGLVTQFRDLSFSLFRLFVSGLTREHFRGEEYTLTNEVGNSGEISAMHHATWT